MLRFDFDQFVNLWKRATSQRAGSVRVRFNSHRSTINCQPELATSKSVAPIETCQKGRERTAACPRTAWHDGMQWIGIRQNHAPGHAVRTSSCARARWLAARQIDLQSSRIGGADRQEPVRKQFAKSLRTRMSCGRCNVARARVPVRSGSDIFLLSYRVGYPCDD